MLFGFSDQSLNFVAEVLPPFLLVRVLDLVKIKLYKVLKSL